MKENTHVIWSDINLNLDDWRDDLKQTQPNADDNFLYKAMYENNKGDFRCKAIHHDGTNYYLYRTFKNGVSDYQIENSKEKLYNGTATRADITRLTRRLGDEIGKVYGWEFSKKQKQEIFER